MHFFAISKSSLQLLHALPTDLTVLGCCKMQQKRRKKTTQQITVTKTSHITTEFKITTGQVEANYIRFVCI